jgi:hypothetical protein
MGGTPSISLSNQPIITAGAGVNIIILYFYSANDSLVLTGAGFCGAMCFINCNAGHTNNEWQNGSTCEVY